MVEKFDRNKSSYCFADPHLYGLLKENAKRMKNNPTEAEKMLWQYLNRSQLGKPFRRQFIILDYIADFVCIPSRLIIELDGGYHNNPEQMKLDENRTRRLMEMGFKVIRFSNEDVFSDIENTLNKIKNEII